MRKRWLIGADLARSFHFKRQIPSDRLSILNAIWEREMGHFSKHWSLAGIKGGILMIKSHSSSAAQELQLRAPEIARNLNKYFSKPWIRGIRTTPS